MYYQNELSWKHEKINNSNDSNDTIGNVGCLLTSLCNIYNFRHNNKITPLILNKELIENGGYTKNNSIIWNVAAKILQCKIEHDYKGDIEYDMNNYYIANFINFDTEHFTNLIGIDNDRYKIYDVWQGLYRIIEKPRRIVKLTFEV